MSDFVSYVFSYLKQALALLIPTALLCGLGLLIASKIFQKKYNGARKFPWSRAVLILMLAGYLAVVFFVTVLRASHYGDHYGNHHLFRAWREAWNNFSEKNWLNVLLNIAMFVPLGVLLPLLKKWFRKWYIMLPTGFLTSLSIEAIQYFSYRGLFDVDDLFCNTLGAMTGFWLMMFFLTAREKKWKQSICHGLALIAVASSVGGIFVAYDAQEYGNLSTSPSFQVDTGDIRWTVSCELSGEGQTVDIYKTQPWTKAECESFGREFLGNLGVDDLYVTIYNEEVYLRENQGSRWIEVFYQDGHYDYADLEDWDIINSPYARTDEASLRKMLAGYGIKIPEEADFSYDAEGEIHYFRVNRHVEGDKMTDGAIAVQYEEGYGIRDISNKMVTFTYHGEAEIISEQEAAQKLMDGWIASGEWLERKNTKQIEIKSCTLSYQVDTKGFYQPVYLMELTSSDTNYEITETVPALK